MPVTGSQSVPDLILAEGIFAFSWKWARIRSLSSGSACGGRLMTSPAKIQIKERKFLDFGSSVYVLRPQILDHQPSTLAGFQKITEKLISQPMDPGLWFLFLILSKKLDEEETWRPEEISFFIFPKAARKTKITFPSSSSREELEEPREDNSRAWMIRPFLSNRTAVLLFLSRAR